MTKTFPKEEIFGLTSQIRRASDSIGLNVAEGSTGKTKAEFKKFLGYAIRSGIEVIACLHLGQRKKFIDSNDFEMYHQRIVQLIIELQSLRKKLI